MGWISGNRINYSQEAPKGHLPWVSGFYEADSPFGQEGVIRELVTAVRTCQRKLSRFSVVSL